MDFEIVEQIIEFYYDGIMLESEIAEYFGVSYDTVMDIIRQHYNEMQRHIFMAEADSILEQD
jgi:hypothetical protein